MKRFTKRILSLFMSITVIGGSMIFNFSVVATAADEIAYFYFNGHTYAIFEDSLSWTEAETYCESLDGHLVTITTPKEQSFIVDIIKSDDAINFIYYLGGLRDETNESWHWITDEPFSYTCWGSYQSKDNYLCISKWSTDDLSDPRPIDSLFGEFDEYCWHAICIDSADEKIIAKSSNFNGFICEWDYNLSDIEYEIAGITFYNNLDFYTKYCDSSNYNVELANMTAAISKAVYSMSDIKNAYMSLGFGSPEVYDYDGSFNPSTCGYAIDFKKSDYSDDYICLIAVRGSSNTSDWVGNFVIDTFDNEKHIGFSFPANRIYEKILYETEYRGITGTVKYVVTGHSRGAAVANLLSVKLMEEGVSAQNIYNYNFACPDVACKSSFPSYTNIFNLCNREDIVPFVPGHIVSAFTSFGTVWGKYGETYWFTKDAPDTINPFADHDISLYLEFFNQQSDPNTWSSSFADKADDLIYSINGIITKVFCPVDVTVTDKYGNEMATVINGEVTYYNDSCGDIIVFVNENKKIIYTDSDVNFNVNLVGTDSGEMTYSVEEYNMLTDEVTQSKTFTNVKLEEGKAMYSPVNNAKIAEDVELLLLNSEDSKTVTHTIDVDGTENKLSLSIDAPETRTVYLGESVKLTTKTNLPDEYKIKWILEGEGVSIKASSTGESCKVTSTSTGNVVIKAYVIDSSGNIVTDENGKPITDSEYLYSESNFWLRLINFLKKLFRIDINAVNI